MSGRVLRKLQILCVGVLLSGLMAGCGKYAPPLPPESFAPARVRTAVVSGTLEGVRFAWDSPSADQRGKELKAIEGYYIERKTLSKEADLLDSDIPFEVVGTVEDTHLVDLDSRRDAAQAEGKPTRRVSADPTLTKFVFLDSGVVPGQRYAYRIVPFNQGGQKGEAGLVQLVTFQGERSEIQSLEMNEASELTF